MTKAQLLEKLNEKKEQIAQLLQQDEKHQSLLCGVSELLWRLEHPPVKSNDVL